MSSARSMTCASRHLRLSTAPSRNHSNTGRSSSYAPNFRLGRPSARGGASAADHGYLHVASSVARVRFSPAGSPEGVTSLGSSRTSSRSVCALPSKPPIPRVSCASTVSPLWPKGGWPRSWDRHAASTTSGSQPSALPSSRPICATSSEWVRRLRTKSSVCGATTCVLAASRRSAELCSTRARSRSKWLRWRLWWSSLT